jgi:hypothetical protein
MIIFLVLAICLISTPAMADAGLPMIIVSFPAMVLALIPIIFIEAYIMKKGGIVFESALKGAAISNIASTIIGIPLAWAVLLFIQFGVYAEMDKHGFEMPSFGPLLTAALNAPMLGPTGSPWQIDIAFLVLLIPFFWVSYFIERRVLRKSLKEYPKDVIHKVCFKANIASYLFLAIFPATGLVHILFFKL